MMEFVVYFDVDCETNDVITILRARTYVCYFWNPFEI